MDHFRYEDWAVTSFRLFAYVTLFALTTRFLVFPLWGRVSDERVALYLEEHEPSLQAAVLSAVGGRAASRARAHRDVSRALVERLVEDAVEKCQTIDFGRPVERPGLRRASALLAAAAALGMAVTILSPAFLRHAAPFLFAPWIVRAASPYAIEVDPGHVTIAARRQPDGDGAARGLRRRRRSSSAVRSGPAGDWKRWPMTADQAADGFRFVLFGLDTASDYYVGGGRRALARRSASTSPTSRTSRRSTSSTASPPTPASRRRRTRTPATWPRCAAPRCACA